MSVCVGLHPQHTLTKIANYWILWATFTELPKSFCTPLSSFWIFSDTHHEHHTDLITFLFHHVLHACHIDTSSMCLLNQWLSPNSVVMPADAHDQLCSFLSPCNLLTTLTPKWAQQPTIQIRHLTFSRHSTEFFLHSLWQHMHRITKRNPGELPYNYLWPEIPLEPR